METLTDERALTVSQPWAWAISMGFKPVENRTWTTTYRGRVWIHAGRGVDKAAFDDPRILRAFHRAAARYRTVLERAVLLAGLLRPDWHIRGAVIATAALVDVHEDTGDCCAPWGDRSHRNPLGNLVTVYHWVLADVQQLDKPLECRGMLGLWRLTADLLARTGR